MLADTPATNAQIDAFQRLQQWLRDRWQKIEPFGTTPGKRTEHCNYDILVVPSISLDRQELLKINGVHHYEERLLYSLMRLRHPQTRLIYVTSQPIPPMIIDYYLQLLPGIPFSHARERLLLFSTYDASSKSLTEKILERPRLMQRIQNALRPQRSFTICFNATDAERTLSVRLGVPLLATDPSLLYWGTKSGSREIFQQTQIPYPDGSFLLKSPEELAIAASKLLQRQPHLQRLVVKLNEGFSGEGNAILNVNSIHQLPPSQWVAALQAQFPHMKFQASGETWETYKQRIHDLGAIVEAYIEGQEKRSPSVQGQIHPSGYVEILSTHDQILGGPDGQIYLGCQFPADAGYRLHLQEYGLQVGKNLAAKGALDRFGVDFVAVPTETGWDLQAVEINLRKGGTTHPFMTMRFLTNGQYYYPKGLFYSQHGKEKYYLASDNLQQDHYRGLLPSDLMDIIASHQLHFDSATETGTVFHLIGSLSEFGKIGLTSIGNSPEQAQDIYNQVIEVLETETNSSEKNAWL
ncbi:peptide ligase PGM1-related protein [Geitlerinema sp. PCC 9228]|jgi:hypothetical protein|uniref:peptide ligase PGM1-related protein n=1 Tax=Geitlerinema sp. PCC 9228 TaxID=111611 RepID=UPI0008F98E8C|nr:peptide ligase PGM1-related protein [Geitlerinema sp. PCC 9228]